MTITEYFAAVGSGFSDKDAAIIGPELERLERLGLSTTHGIRDAARDKNNPLHPYVFDCTRKDAADRYYLAQAGRVARSIQVEIRTVSQDGNEQVQRMRGFYPVQTAADADTDEDHPSERRYISIATVLKDRDYASQVWREGLRHLQLFRSRFRSYDDVFGSVLRAIDETEQRLQESDIAA